MGVYSLSGLPILCITVQEEASMLPSDAGEEDVIQESQDAYERTDTRFSLGKQACKGLQHCLT